MNIKEIIRIFEQAKYDWRFRFIPIFFHAINNATNRGFCHYFRHIYTPQFDILQSLWIKHRTYGYITDENGYHFYRRGSYYFGRKERRKAINLVLKDLYNLQKTGTKIIPYIK